LRTRLRTAPSEIPDVAQRCWQTGSLVVLLLSVRSFWWCAVRKAFTLDGSAKRETAICSLHDFVLLMDDCPCAVINLVSL